MNFLDIISTKQFYTVLNNLTISEFYLLHKSVIDKKSTLSSIKRKVVLAKGQLLKDRLQELEKSSIA